VYWRQLAIDTVGKECADSGQAVVVAGHFMFWPEEEEDGWLVYTQNDLDTFTHILYLDVPAEVVAQRHLDDTERSRPSTSVTHLRKWQQAEKAQLRRVCRHYGILFSLVSQHPTLLNKGLDATTRFLVLYREVQPVLSRKQAGRGPCRWPRPAGDSVGYGR
jgi:hypothetical protein